MKRILMLVEGLILILITISPLQAQIPAYVPTAELVGWWPFTWNANDISGNNYNGTLNGVTITSDRFGNANAAYSFNGSGNYITLPNIIPVQVGTISFWFQTNSSNTQILVYHGNSGGDDGFGSANPGTIEDHTGISSGFGSGPLITYNFDNSAGTAYYHNTPISLNQWHHLVVSYNTLNAFCYLNGELIQTMDISNETGNNLPTMTYIGRPRMATRFFSGKFDDLGVWNRVLSQCEIADLYNNQLGSLTTSSESYVSSCENYSWNNQIYTESGQYTFQTSNAAGCDSIATLNLTITQTSSGSETITECNSFTWNANNQTYTSSGQYSAVLTNSVGCDSTVTLNLTINSVDNGITQVDNFTLQANAMGATYQWIDCKDDLPVSGATNQQFSPATNGDYAVVVTQDGCADTSECLSIVHLSILEHEKTLLVVYPNPATSMITIENPQSIPSTYVIIDVQGRQVHAGKLQGKTTSIDVAHIAKGMYTVSFSDSKLKEIKFIKE